MREILVALSVVLAAPVARAAPSIELTVQLTGVENRTGLLQCAAWSSEAGFPFDHDRAVAHADAVVDGNTATCVLNVAPGTIAVAVMHDENGNGRVDTNFVGMPTEGWATSNNVVRRFRAPTFAESSVELVKPRILQLILHY